MTAERRAHLAVAAGAVCFGATFPVTKEALDGVGPYAIVALRFLLGGLVLLPVARRRPSTPGEWRGALVAGAVLLAGYLVMTVGLQWTTSTAAAFITYLLIVIVPVLSAAVLRKVPSPPVVAGVVLATAGLFLLAGGLRLGRGETLVLACAFAFAVHILVLDGLAPRHDPIRLAAFQLLVVGLAGLPLGAVADGYRLDGGAWAAVAFLAMAGVGGLVLQIWGQRLVGPTRTSLLLMIEPVIAAAGGYLVGERVGAGGAVGAALILAGIAVAEAVPARRREPLDPVVK